MGVLPWMATSFNLDNDPDYITNLGHSDSHKNSVEYHIRWLRHNENVGEIPNK